MIRKISLVGLLLVVGSTTSIVSASSGLDWRKTDALVKIIDGKTTVLQGISRTMCGSVGLGFGAAVAYKVQQPLVRVFGGLGAIIMAGVLRSGFSLWKDGENEQLAGLVQLAKLEQEEKAAQPASPLATSKKL